MVAKPIIIWHTRLAPSSVIWGGLTKRAAAGMTVCQSWNDPTHSTRSLVQRLSVCCVLRKSSVWPNSCNIIR